jgi:pimeloyl-ACP methyl ester carboxylesterase
MYAILGMDAKYFRKSFVRQVGKAVNGYDKRILLQPDFAAAFGEACAECFAQGSDGLVRDAELAYRRWAFDVGAIERPVHMWQGLDDCLVPASINKPVADRMPGAVWHPVEGAGHFVAIGAADEIFAVAAEELGSSK